MSGVYVEVSGISVRIPSEVGRSDISKLVPRTPLPSVIHTLQSYTHTKGILNQAMRQHIVYRFYTAKPQWQ